VPPFKARNDTQRHSDNSQGRNDQPLSQTATLVWINPENDFDPIMPEQGNYGDQASNQSEQGLYPESATQTLRHTSPKRGSLKAFVAAHYRHDPPRRHLCLDLLRIC
jgi:hypothetical protein